MFVVKRKHDPQDSVKMRNYVQTLRTCRLRQHGKACWRPLNSMNTVSTSTAFTWQLCRLLLQRSPASSSNQLCLHPFRHVSSLSQTSMPVSFHTPQCGVSAMSAAPCLTRGFATMQTLMCLTHTCDTAPAFAAILAMFGGVPSKIICCVL